MRFGRRTGELRALYSALLIGTVVALGSSVVGRLFPEAPWVDNAVAGFIATGLSLWAVMLQIHRNRDRVLFQHYARNRLQAISLLVHGFAVESQVRTELDLLARDISKLRPFHEDSPDSQVVRRHNVPLWTFDQAAHRALDAMESVVMCDARGVLRYFNKATRKLHGLPQLDIPAEQWAEYYQLYDPDNVRLLRADDVPLHRALRGEVVDRVPMVIRKRSGKCTKVEVSGSLLHDDRGTVIGAMVIQIPVGEISDAPQPHSPPSDDRACA
jgi:hypothetical protein